MVALCAVPALVVAARLQAVNRSALETAERNLQASVLSEVSAAALRTVRDTESDAKAVAGALALAAARNDGESAALDAVRALIATRLSIDAARFEVPAANVDTVIGRAGARKNDVPHSTQETRRE